MMTNPSTHLYTWAIAIQAASKEENFDCILVPSEIADMESGGASYFFTRLRKLPSSGGSGNVGFYFKPHLLRRMDAITYEGDKYGRVTGNAVQDC
jgi:hypothetical protein